MCFPILYQICVDFWKPIFKAMRLPTGGQEVCTSLALKDTSPRCRTCCLGNSSMFKSPMATFSKELEAIRNVPVHPLSAAAWWLTYGYCMLKSLCVRHACTRRRVQARLCARQRAAFVLAFSLFLFVIVNDRFWECPGNRRRKKRRKTFENDLLELCSKILCILSKISWRSFGLSCATTPLKDERLYRKSSK